MPANFSKPVRLQLSRRKGFDLQKMSVGYNGLPAVKCARPDRFCNIFIVSPTVKPGSRSGALYITVPTFDDAIDCFRERVESDPGFQAEIKRELKGKNLACWCRHGTPCHCDILLKIANEP